MSWGFEPGRVYNRRADIHARFGGQQQGGIITPAQHGIVVIITGEAGQAHGYADRSRPDGVFEYFGEGQRGDMVMQRGNQAILQHTEKGRDLLLFAKTSQGLRYRGQFVYEAHHIEPAPDTEGKMRNAIVFELRPLEDVVIETERETANAASSSLPELRKRALEAVRSQPKAGQKLAKSYERAAVIKDYIFARAKGHCEFCTEAAPFTTAAGRPFLEAHHIRRMSDGGPDDPSFMIGVCPNCHRRAHYGSDAAETNTKMQVLVSQREADLEGASLPYR